MLKQLINFEPTNAKAVFHVENDLGHMNHREKNNICFRELFRNSFYPEASRPSGNDRFYLQTVLKQKKKREEKNHLFGLS